MSTEYCECETPLLPIGGWGCERCGKTVESEEKRNYLIPVPPSEVREGDVFIFIPDEPAPPTLGVSVEETVSTDEKMG